MVTEGPPSRRLSRLEGRTFNEGFSNPQTTLKPLRTVVHTPPLYPLRVVEGGRGLVGNAPPPSTTDPKRGPGGEELAGVLSAWSAAIGFNQPRTVAQVIDECERKLKLGLLTVAAMENGLKIIDPCDWSNGCARSAMSRLIILRCAVMAPTERARRDGR